MISLLRQLLYEPSVAHMNIDHGERIAFHRSILKEKRLLRSAFNTFYSEMLDANEKLLSGEGLELELGTGAGFMKDVRAELITSDVFPVQGIDRVVDAQKMDFEDASVRCIYAINVFHHLADPEKFLLELSRVLIKGGGCILIEPHNGLASRILHTYMHSDEHFDTKSLNWQCGSILGPMSGANQALSYIVFERDRKLFESRFGDSLEIIDERYLANFLRYFLSGGLNFRQLAPNSFIRFLSWVEITLSPVAKHVSFHRMTVLRKK